MKSRGAVLFHVFLFKLLDRFGDTLPDVFATPWNEASPRTTLDGRKDPVVAVVEFSDPQRGRVLIALGNATQPGPQARAVFPQRAAPRFANAPADRSPFGVARSLGGK